MLDDICGFDAGKMRTGNIATTGTLAWEEPDNQCDGGTSFIINYAFAETTCLFAFSMLHPNLCQASVSYGGLIPFLQLLRFQFNTERKNTCRARKGKVQTFPSSKNFAISDHSIAWSQQISFKSLGRGWLEKDIPLLPSSRFLYPEDMIGLALKSQSSKLMMVELDDSKRAQKS